MATKLLPNAQEIYQQILTLEKCDVTNGHLASLQTLKDFIRPYMGAEEVSNENGCHYSICAWSKRTTVGPDTCECYHMEKKVMEFNNLTKEITIYLEKNVRISKLEARVAELTDTPLIETPVQRKKSVFCCF